MGPKRFARVENGLVAEVFVTADDTAKLFHPALVWVEVGDAPEVLEGWRYDGSHFTAPAPVPAPAGPSLTELQAQLNALSSKIAALTHVS